MATLRFVRTNDRDFESKYWNCCVEATGLDGDKLLYDFASFLKEVTKGEMTCAGCPYEEEDYKNRPVIGDYFTVSRAFHTKGEFVAEFKEYLKEFKEKLKNEKGS